MRIWGQAVGGRGQAEPPAAPSGRIAKAEVRLEQAQKVEIRRRTDGASGFALQMRMQVIERPDQQSGWSGWASGRLTQLRLTQWVQSGKAWDPGL